MFLDPAATPGFKRTLFNAIVAPRPIGWISTINGKGQVNLAPFSHFNLVSTSPPVVIFSCNAPADRHEKDTIANVRETGEFVTNLATWDLREPMNLSSMNAPYGTDEFELAGLEKAPSVMVKPPRVAASPASMECRVAEDRRHRADRARRNVQQRGVRAHRRRASGRAFRRCGREFRHRSRRATDTHGRQPLFDRRPHGHPGPAEPAARLTPHNIEGTNMTTTTETGVRETAVYDLAPGAVARGQNFFVQWLEGDGKVFEAHSAHEMLLLLPGDGAEVRIGRSGRSGQNAAQTVAGRSVCVLPAGEIAVQPNHGARAVLIASSREDLAPGTARNDHDYASPDARIIGSDAGYRRTRGNGELQVIRDRRHSAAG